MDEKITTEKSKKTEKLRIELLPNAKIEIIHERVEASYINKLEQILNKPGTKSKTISSGITIQGQAKDYWAIVVIYEQLIQT